MFGVKVSEEKKMFCFEVDVELQREIKALACRKGIPLNRYMNEILQVHLGVQKGKQNESRNDDEQSNSKI